MMGRTSLCWAQCMHTQPTSISSAYLPQVGLALSQKDTPRMEEEVGSPREHMVSAPLLHWQTQRGSLELPGSDSRKSGQDICRKSCHSSHVCMAICSRLRAAACCFSALASIQIGTRNRGSVAASTAERVQRGIRDCPRRPAERRLDTGSCSNDWTRALGACTVSRIAQMQTSACCKACGCGKAARQLAVRARTYRGLPPIPHRAPCLTALSTSAA